MTMIAQSIPQRMIAPRTTTNRAKTARTVAAQTTTTRTETPLTTTYPVTFHRETLIPGEFIRCTVHVTVPDLDLPVSYLDKWGAENFPLDSGTVDGDSSMGKSKDSGMGKSKDSDMGKSEDSGKSKDSGKSDEPWEMFTESEIDESRPTAIGAVTAAAATAYRTVTSGINVVKATGGSLSDAGGLLGAVWSEMLKNY